MKKISRNQLQSLELQNEHTYETQKQNPLLALDWGEKFCGLAWTPDGQVCLPLGVFERTQIENMINKFAQEKGIRKIIVGLPISGDGTENHICNSIREFVKNFINIDVEWSNERGSSQATISPNNERIDDLAAVHILEQYLRKQEVSHLKKHIKDQQ